MLMLHAHVHAGTEHVCCSFPVLQRALAGESHKHEQSRNTKQAVDPSGAMEKGRSKGVTPVVDCMSLPGGRRQGLGDRIGTHHDAGTSRRMHCTTAQMPPLAAHHVPPVKIHSKVPQPTKLTRQNATLETPTSSATTGLPNFSSKRWHPPARSRVHSPEGVLVPPGGSLSDFIRSELICPSHKAQHSSFTNHKNFT